MNAARTPGTTVPGVRTNGDFVGAGTFPAVGR